MHRQKLSANAKVSNFPQSLPPKHPINAIHGLDHRLILIAGVNFVAAENRQISAAGIYTSSPPGWFWRYFDVVAAVQNAKYGRVSSVGP
jgi:hypothetical protein